MARPKNPRPYRIIQKAGKKNLYIQFRNEITGKFDISKSAGTTDRAIAERKAIEMLTRKNSEETTAPKTLAILEAIRSADDLTAKDCAAICDELKRRGLLACYTPKESRAAVCAYDFLVNAWSDKAGAFLMDRRGGGVYETTRRQNLAYVKKYWRELLGEKMLGEITRADWTEFLSKISGLDKATGTKQAIRLAAAEVFRWAFKEGITESDFSAKTLRIPKDDKPREILRPETVQALFTSEWETPAHKLGNLIACVTGMRIGEILALRGCDIGNGVLYVRHSYNRTNGLKTTKTGKTRVVSFPFPALAQAMIEHCKENPFYTGAESFVFWSIHRNGSPESPANFLLSLRTQLERIGFGKDAAARYTFHAWRHYFTTYMNGRVDVSVLSRNNGHSVAMINDRYGNHQRVDDMARLAEAQAELFGGFVEGGRASLPSSR